MNKLSYFELRNIIYFVLFLILFSFSSSTSMAKTTAKVVQNNSVNTAWAQLPNLFEARDNADGSTGFMTRGKGYFLTINQMGHTLALYTSDLDGKNAKETTIQMRLVGALPHSLHGSKPFSGKINYLLSNDKTEWDEHVSSYSEVVAKTVYPGIDLRYYYAQQQVEYDFIVAPKANAKVIRYMFEGADKMSINSNGNLVLNTSQGEVHHQKPIIYQHINGKRIAIEGQYSLSQDEDNANNVTAHAQQVGFIIGDYNDSFPLIIDPIIDYASYIGGSGPDQGSAIAVDATGNIYITGTSFSSSLPTQTPYQDKLAGRSDIFIAKFNPSGDTLLFATYLGGQDYDKATDISVDDLGQIVITGITSSNDFPIENGLQANYGGGRSDAFISKLSADGSQLLFSTYVGGSSQDKGYGITLDNQNNIYLTGETSSDDFPIENALQVQRGGHTDAYIMKLNNDGSHYIYASYIGGNSFDGGRSIAVDNRGYATITGTTYSKTDFPLHNAVQDEHGGNSDVFISQLNTDGSAFNYSTYLGGSTEDFGFDIAIDSQNNAVIVGQTGNWFALSQADDFPTKNALQDLRGGLSDAFISKLSADGGELLFSSYLGGSESDLLNSVAIDESDNIYVLGSTQSATGLPVVNALQQSLQGAYSDAYIAKLDSTGATVLFASYFGGSKADKGLGIAVKGETLYMTGITGSNADFPSKNALQPLFGGGVDDMFVAKVGTGSDLTLSVDNISPSYINRNSHKLFTVSGSNLADAVISTANEGLAIFDVTNTADSIEFRVSATNDASLGEADLTFSSVKGSAVAKITIAPQLPSLILSPAPIAMAVHSDPLTLDMHLSGTDVVDHVITLTSSDPTIASISPSSITISAGQRYPAETIQLTSHIKGSASLDMVSTTLEDIHTTAFITDEPYIPEIGEHTAQSKPLGIIVTQAEPPAQLIEYGPFVAQLKVFKESTVTSTNPTITPILSPNLGISFGSSLSSVSPHAYIVGNTSNMTIHGQGLEDVTSVEVIPADGVTLANINIAADGKSISVDMMVLPEATLGTHKVILSSSTGGILPETAGSDKFYIAAGLPEIDSISPIVMVKSQTKLLTIRGRNLTDTQAITLLPADAITLSSTITINGSGTELSVKINVGELTAVGPRTVMVTTLAGSSSTTASSANTLLISSEEGEYYSGILSPEVGIVKGDSDSGSTAKTIELHTATLGISLGSILTGITPTTQTIASNFVLTLQGSELHDVDAVRIEPEEGVTLGSVTANSDGKTATVAVTIDANADQTVHKVIASANGVDILAASADADRLLITALQPEIEDITPNYLLAGGDAVRITVRGQYLNNAQSVMVGSAADLSISQPVVNAEGTRLTVTITAGNAATLGAHLFKVITPSGETSNTLTPTNTLTVIADKAQIKPVYTTHLGIQKQTSIVTTPTISRLHISPLLGVEKQAAATEITHTIPLNSAQLGVVLGDVISRVSPTILPVDSAIALTFSGIGLDKVESISFEPSDGITQTDDFIVSSDKTTLALPVAIAADATQQMRQITVHTATAVLPFVAATSNRVRVVDNVLPQISSLDPIQQVADTSFTLTIHGANLQNTQAVEMSPAEGITLSAPTLSAEGSQLTVQVIIAADATIGGRVLIVHTLTGSSTTAATAANTFSVVNQ